MREPVRRTWKEGRKVSRLHDSLDPTRMMLARHQIYRRLAPWVQENPLQLHLTNATTEAFDTALEQMKVRSPGSLRLLVWGCRSGFVLVFQDSQRAWGAR